MSQSDGERGVWHMNMKTKFNTRFRHSSLLAKIIIVAALVYAALSLLSLHTQIISAERDVDTLSRQVEQQKEVNANLQGGNGEMNYSMEDAARDRLGLILPNEKVFYDVGG